MRPISILVGWLFCPLLWACDAPEFRQFDFWLGEWQVTANDKVAGTNRIQQDLNNCIVTEHYQTPSGYEGRSITIYDRQRGQWVQTWVDNQGVLLQLYGNFDGNTMLLSGAGKSPDGKSLYHQLRWTPNADGTVRQHWQQRQDDSQAWTTVFDGLYQPLNE